MSGIGAGAATGVAGAAKGTLRRLIAASLPQLVRRSVQSGLSGVWSRGEPLPPGGLVLAPNHHAWWDGYLAWLFVTRQDRTMSLVMDDLQLGRFAFFRHHGALGRGEPREALRRLARGDALVVYPEGRLRPPGPPGPLQEGAAFFALRAGVPLVPVGVRVVVRGAQRPEAYMSVGAPLAPVGSRPALTAALGQALRGLLTEVDAAVMQGDPEAPLPDFAPLLAGRRSTHERTAWLERLWTS